MIDAGNAEHRSDLPIAIIIILAACVYAALIAGGRIQHSAGSHETQHVENATPHYLSVAPFVFLLAAIAVFPLLRKIGHWWEDNLHRFYVAAGLASCTLLYYGFSRGPTAAGHVVGHAILQEYIPFIVLLFSLFTISGGIRITGDLVAAPATNCAFLAIGGLLASLIGTTGAAMLLIRPLVETNMERKHVQHTIVFFIFIVCNCGGCLLPIGDPPLFLGYLRGVEFLWTFTNLFLPWLFVVTTLIGVYYLLDRCVFYRMETPTDVQRDRTQIRPLVIRGRMPNAALLLGVILAVALLDPNKPIEILNNWQPWPYLREVVQLLLVAASLLFGSREPRTENKFNYGAIFEVAALFIGIFITMQPALEILNVNGPALGVNSPVEFFWATGTLSSVLDNAPTYVVFFETADAAFEGDLSQIVAEAGPARDTLVGISLGAVFMGSMTYIGNGPNFMVRAIAEQMGIRMPSFFGYVIFYSGPVLLPVFALLTFLFLRS